MTQEKPSSQSPAASSGVLRTFHRAVPSDIEAVLALYRSELGDPFCAWDETYPGRENIADDLSVQALFVLESDAGLLAVATIRPWPEHDPLNWSPSMKHPCDLMRIGVDRKFHGQGIGAEMLQRMIGISKQLGYDGMRILVSQKNLPAVRMYRRAGAVYRGDTFAYDIDWFCYELVY